MTNKRWLPYLLLFCAVWLPYSFSLQNQPIGDDGPMLQLRLAPEVVSDVFQLWQENYWGPLDESGLYRPLALTMLYTERTLFGLENTPYRIVGLLLYSLCGMACFLFVSQIMGRLGAMAAALLFVLHPVHVEVAITAYGQVEMLAAILVFAALYAHIRATRDNELLWTTAAAALFLAALLSKEVAVCFPVLAMLTRGIWCKPGVRGTSRWLGRFDALYMGAIGVFVLLRFTAIDTFGTPPQAAAMAGYSFLHRIQSIATHALGNYMRLTIFPESQSLIYDFFPSVRTDIGWTIAALLVLIAADRFLGRRATLYAMGWFLASWLVFSNIFIPTGLFLAERVLFLPIFGICFLFGTAAERAVAARRPAIVGALMLVLALAAAQSGSTAWKWRTWEQGLRASITEHPGSPNARSILALTLLQKPDSTEADRNEAEALLHFVLEQYPTVPEAHRGLGLAAKARGDRAAAIAHLRRALELRPRDVMIQADLEALTR